MSRLTRTDPGGPLEQRMEAGETKGKFPQHKETSQLVYRTCTGQLSLGQKWIKWGKRIEGTAATGSE